MQLESKARRIRRNYAAGKELFLKPISTKES